MLPRVARGDDGAVKQVLDRYSGLVWSLALRLSRNESEAEEAVQEAFIDIWKSAGRFDPSVASEATFIAMIARRRLIDRRRKEARRGATEAIREGDAASDALPHRAEAGEEAARAVDALERLAPDQQRALRLAVLRGLSHEHIAGATGMPLGTVKTNIRRGLIRMRELLSASPSRPTTGVSR